MRPLFPVVESVTDHHGRFDRIADWILECLDSQLPFPSGHLVLYLCYHSADRDFFSSPQRNDELGNALLGSYKREVAFDGMGFGDLRFDLSKARGSLLLTIRDSAKFEVDAHADSSPSRPTVIEFHWQESETNILPGTMSMVRRWIKPLSGDSVMTALLSVASSGGAATARHMKLWQRQVRTSEPGIYLPEGRTSITIGSVPGCDLWVPQLEAPLQLQYESSSDEWSWMAPSAPWLSSGSWRGNMSQEFKNRNGGSITIKGERLAEESTLDEIRRQNHLPSFVVEIVGCLLPSPGEHEWFSSVSEMLPALTSLASSATELPGGGWLYCKRDSSRPYLLRAGESPPGNALTQDGKDQELQLRFGKSPRRTGRWTEFTKGLLPSFRGELSLTPPLTSQLAADVICGDLPNEIFPGYVDRSIGRPPCRLESGDGRHYILAFNASAKHPVFVFSKPWAEMRRYDPSSSRVIDLGTGADFIFGATHYRLRQLPDVVTDDAAV